MKPNKPVPAFDDRVPRDRYCDLILTGGVTSAIAYPGAVFALAMAYRLQSIGGSSSGAGVAALAAAAEYRRRKGSPEGYRLLLERIDAVADVYAKRTGLEWLFQPERGHERLFKAMLNLFGVTATGGRAVWDALVGIARAYWLAPLLSLLTAAAIVQAAGGATAWCTPSGWIAFGATTLIGLIPFTAGILLIDLLRLAKADFGLCSGMPPAGESPPRAPLTVWLHELVQEVAGRSAAAPPLTFADLATAPGAPRDTLGDLSEAGAASIRLQMFTSCLTHGRPYLLPLDDEDPPLYFRPAEMRRLFPNAVVDHMEAHSSPRADSFAVIEPEPVGPIGAQQALWRLPREHLPIVVAARMSVSFPVLFTAVPLWALDQRQGQAPRYRRLLFADGGLCSNFPIHLFDSPIPAWPTFGISLQDDESDDNGPAPTFSQHDPYDPSFDQQVDSPAGLGTAPCERWDPFAEQAGGLRRLGGFAGALLSTVKDWNDATLARMPGVRDRVVPIRLPPHIGGLNLRMTSDQIRWLGTVGVVAARRLLERFAKGTDASGLAPGWLEHRWIRLNLFAASLAESLEGLAWSASRERHVLPLAEQVQRAAEEPAPMGPTTQPPQGGTPAPPPIRIDPAQAAALQGVIAVLAQTENALASRVGQQPLTLLPRPLLRLRPPL